MGSEQNNLFQTNNYSIVSKYSAVRSGYFQDPNLRKLIEDTLEISSWRRTPLVNRGYAARLLAMDQVIGSAIKFEDLDCSIVLGAGYDTLPFRWLVKDSKCCWIEIDLPQVVETKCKFIIDNKILGPDNELKQVENGILSSTDSRYNLISCDLKHTDKLSACLKKVISFIGTKRRFLIINEVCFCYLEQNDLLEIMKAVKKSIDNIAFRIYYIGYEQVKPFYFSPYSKIMIDHFQMLGYPLKHYPTSLELKKLFCISLSFTYSPSINNMYQIYHNYLMEEKLEIEAFREEPFDEFEEMDLYLGHYSLIKAVMILKEPFIFPLSPVSIDDLEIEEKREKLRLERMRAPGVETKVSRNFISSPIRRYGHASCSLDEAILISGGFGISDSHQHKRLHDCTVLKRNDSNIESYSLDLRELKSNVSLDRMHGQIARLSQNLLFFNGGRQSPLKQEPTNVNFIAALDDNVLKIRHKFNFGTVESTLRWRHRLTPVMMHDLCWQVGGIGGNVDSSCIIWNLSSDKYGIVESRAIEALNRHSFGMDMKDHNVALIYGGLRTNSLLRDYPVDEDESILLCDLRTRYDRPHEVYLENFEPSYGASVHFINDTSFIRIGGISTKTGLLYNGIELVDLRNKSTVQLIDNIYDESVLDVPFLLTSATTYHSKEDKTILTLGGGGNYFTFGTHFNEHHLLFDYNQYDT